MNSIKSLRYKKAGTTLLFALFAMACFAQNNVRLLNGSAFISESAASAADGRLATELPNHDVRISYVTSFVGVDDRNKTYKANNLIAFSQLPNTGNGFVPATQEQKDAAVNAGIHLAITTLPSPSEETIHIIYAVSVSTDAERNEVFSARKFFRFGDEVDRRAKKIVEQIIPDPELLAAGDVGGNDVYLADYVEELIAALNDPDYIINGTIEYNGESYFDGDTIFYFHQADEIIETEVAGLQELKLLINPDYPVSPVNWVETEIPDAGTLLASNSGGNANIKIKANHFTGIAKLTGTFGSETTTVWYYPINLQITISNDAVQESRSLEPVDIKLTNNGNSWINHPSLTLQISLADPIFNGTDMSDMEIFRSIRYPDGDDPIYNWEWDVEVCDRIRYIGSAQRSIVGTESVKTIQRAVKCPINVDSIVIAAQNIGSSSSISQFDSYTRRARSGETLYIVSANNDLSRRLSHQIFWKEDILLIDTWQNPENLHSKYGLTEPNWDFASATDGAYDVDVTMPNSLLNDYNTISFPFSVDYDDSTLFPGTFIGDIFGLDFGQDNINFYETSMSAFDTEHSVRIGFLRPYREESSSALGSLWNFRTNVGDLGEHLEGAPLFIKIFAGVTMVREELRFFFSEARVSNDRIETLMNILLPETSLGDTWFNAEINDDPKYKKVHEKAYVMSWDFNLVDNPIRIWGTSFWFGQAGLFFEPSADFYLQYEIVDEKPLGESDFTTIETSLEGGINGSMNFFGGVTMNEEYENTLQLELTGGVSSGIELKIKKITPVDGSEDKVEGEFAIAPVVLTLTLKIIFGDTEGDWDWTVLDRSWPFHLTDKIEWKREF